MPKKRKHKNIIKKTTHLKQDIRIEITPGQEKKIIQSVKKTLVKDLRVTTGEIISGTNNANLYAQTTIEKGLKKTLKLMIKSGFFNIERLKVTDLISLAVHHDKIDMLKILLKSDIIVKNSKSYVIYNPLTKANNTVFDELSHAILLDKISMDRGREILKLLVNSGIDIDTRGMNGSTSFQNALGGAKSFKNSYELAQMLLDEGADINAYIALKGSNKNETSLMSAIKYCEKKIFDFLLQTEKLDVNLPNQFGVSPLHAAALEESGYFITPLIEHKANINAIARDGCTPLLYAVSKGHKECVKYLTKHNADVDIQSKDGISAITEALTQSHADIFALLYSKTINLISSKDFFTFLTKMSHRIWKLDKTTVNHQGQKVTTQVLEQSKNPILDTIMKGSNKDNIEDFEQVLHFTLKDYFIKSNFDENIYNIKIFLEFVYNNQHLSQILKKYNNDLCLFAEFGSAKLLPLIKKLNIDLNIPYDDGSTLLHIAISSQNHSVALELVTTYKINNDAKNSIGLTPAHLAARYGMQDVLQVLLEHVTKQEELISILHFSQFGGFDDCIDILKNALSIPLVVTIEELDEPEAVVHQALVEAPVDLNSVDLVEEECLGIQQKLDAYHQSVHKYYQSQKASNLAISEEISTSKGWIIKQNADGSSVIYSAFKKLSGKVFEVLTSHNKFTYFAIANMLNIEADLLIKFENALKNGFVGPHGKSGVKILQAHNVDSLYEIKIFSSQYGKYRLYSDKKYINNDGDEIIIFEKAFVDHDKIRVFAQNSHGITTISTENFDYKEFPQILNYDIDNFLPSWPIDEEEKKDEEIMPMGDMFDFEHA